MRRRPWAIVLFGVICENGAGPSTSTFTPHRSRSLRARQAHIPPTDDADPKRLSIDEEVLGDAQRGDRVLVKRTPRLAVMH